jgi:hypothetical protein
MKWYKALSIAMEGNKVPLGMMEFDRNGFN